MRLGRNFDWQEGTGGRWHYEHRGEVRFRELQLCSSARHQRDNAATALCTAVLLEKCGQHLTAGQVRGQLAGVHLPGRLELFPGSPPVLLDVAHNPASFRALAAFLSENFNHKRILLISGILEQKDYRACLKQVLPQVKQAIFARLSHPRSRSPSDLAAFASSLGVSTQIVETEEAAFERMRHRKVFDLAVIAGSFTLAGAYMVWKKAAERSEPGGRK